MLCTVRDYQWVDCLFSPSTHFNLIGLHRSELLRSKFVLQCHLGVVLNCCFRDRRGYSWQLSSLDLWLLWSEYYIIDVWGDPFFLMPSWYVCDKIQYQVNQVLWMSSFAFAELIIAFLTRFSWELTVNIPSTESMYVLIIFEYILIQFIFWWLISFHCFLKPTTPPVPRLPFTQRRHTCDVYKMFWPYQSSLYSGFQTKTTVFPKSHQSSGKVNICFGLHATTWDGLHAYRVVSKHVKALPVLCFDHLEWFRPLKPDTWSTLE